MNTENYTNNEYRILPDIHLKPECLDLVINAIESTIDHPMINRLEVTPKIDIDRTTKDPSRVVLAYEGVFEWNDGSIWNQNENIGAVVIESPKDVRFTYMFGLLVNSEEPQIEAAKNKYLQQLVNSLEPYVLHAHKANAWKTFKRMIQRDLNQCILSCIDEEHTRGTEVYEKATENNIWVPATMFRERLHSLAKRGILDREEQEYVIPKTEGEVYNLKTHKEETRSNKVILPVGAYARR